MYTTIIDGTRRSATAAMRRMPPRRTRPTAVLISRPGTHTGTSSPVRSRAASVKVRAMVFDCAMLPVPNSAVAAPKKANMEASAFPAAACGTPRVM